MTHSTGQYEIPEYELDEEDENFLQKHLKSRNQSFALNEDILERIIDFLEKESFSAVCTFFNSFFALIILGRIFEGHSIKRKKQTTLLRMLVER